MEEIEVVGIRGYRMV